MGACPPWREVWLSHRARIIASAGAMASLLTGVEMAVPNLCRAFLISPSMLVEWLASELCGYVVGQVGDRAQQHAHLAGPTAVAILSVVAEDLDPRPQDPAGTERLVRIGALYLRYFRDGHQVEDAREMALTFALWAGSQLAALMLHAPGRITSYLDARDHAVAKRQAKTDAP